MATALSPFFFQACFPLECFIIRALHSFCHYMCILFIVLPLLQSATCKGKKSVSASKGALSLKNKTKQNNIKKINKTQWDQTAVILLFIILSLLKINRRQQLWAEELEKYALKTK